MHWSWENNRKLRPGQAPRSRTLRATRGPPPSGSLIINETWGWDRRPWLNTKRERAGREGVLRERKGPESSSGYSPCFHCMLQRLQTQQFVQPSDHRGELEWQILVQNSREVTEEEKEQGGERGGKVALPSWGEKKQFMEWKTTWKSTRCFPWNPAVPKLLFNKARTCPGGTHAETSITSTAWWKSS